MANLPTKATQGSRCHIRYYNMGFVEKSCVVGYTRLKIYSATRIDNHQAIYIELQGSIWLKQHLGQRSRIVNGRSSKSRLVSRSRYVHKNKWRDHCLMLELVYFEYCFRKLS